MSVQKVVNNDNAADMNNTYENSMEIVSSSTFSFSITVTDGNLATATAPAAGTVLEAGPTRLTGAVTTVASGPVQTLTITYGNYPSSLADGDKPTDETHAVTVNSTNDDDTTDNAVYTARITSDSAASALVIVVSRIGNATPLSGSGVTLDIEIRKRGNALA